MKTYDCQVACSDAVALGDAARARVHRKCPGAYVTRGGERQLCDCGCHGDVPADLRFNLIDTSGRALPVVEGPPGADARGEVDKTEKRPKKALNGTCECGCEAPARSRFLPGHDAKLKSRLMRDAEGGSVEALLELKDRDWLRLLPKATLKRIPQPVIAEARRRYASRTSH